MNDLAPIAVLLRENGGTITQIAVTLGLPRSTVGEILTGIHPLPALPDELPDPDTERLRLLTSWCTRCHQHLPWAMFWARSKWPDGTMRLPQSHCRDCVKARRRELRDENPDAYRARERAAYQRMMSDPARAAKRRETQRQNSVVHRRRHGGRPGDPVEPSSS